MNLDYLRGATVCISAITLAQFFIDACFYSHEASDSYYLSFWDNLFLAVLWMTVIQSILQLIGCVNQKREFHAATGSFFIFFGLVTSLCCIVSNGKKIFDLVRFNDYYKIVIIFRTLCDTAIQFASTALYCTYTRKCKNSFLTQALQQ